MPCYDLITAKLAHTIIVHQIKMIKEGGKKNPCMGEWWEHSISKQEFNSIPWGGEGNWDGIIVQVTNSSIFVWPSYWDFTDIFADPDILAFDINENDCLCVCARLSVTESDLNIKTHIIMRRLKEEGEDEEPLCLGGKLRRRRRRRRWRLI